WTRPRIAGPASTTDDFFPFTLALAGPDLFRVTFGEPTYKTTTLVAIPPPMDIVLSEVMKDSDGDGWTDLEEQRLRTNDHLADTDGDGVPDGRDVCPNYAPAANDDDEEAQNSQAR